MNELQTFCTEIGLPQEVTDELTALGSAPDTGDCLLRLISTEYASAERELKTLLGADERGFGMLRAMLTAALKTRERYRDKAIPDGVYLKTMQCFSRFVKEHRESYGYYGFDRSFWTGRQLSMQLFRLGELEYEKSVFRGADAISVHIPSDADLSPAAIDASLRQARDFFAKYFPAYACATYYCCSWLLSPALKKLLPAQSKILLFQRRFNILSTDEAPESYKQWVFKNKNLAPEDFPENTSLQKSMKRYVLQGGKIGEALGTLNF